jgi:hypothetical protein
MRSIIRTLALGIILAAGTATGPMAQNYYENGGYGAYYGNGNGGHYSDGPGYYGRHGRYFGNGEYVPGPVVRPYAAPYGYSSNNYGYGTSEQSGWGSGGGAAYDREYNRGYWGH